METMQNPNRGARQVHGFIGSALIGTDPFDPRSWSGISKFLFEEMRQQGVLHGASGGEVTGLRRLMLLASSFHPRRETWRLRYYLGTRYRQSLTRVLAPTALSLPAEVAVFQLGGLFDLPSVVGRQKNCFSYHDGNMAQRLKNPYASSAVPAWLAQTAMSYEHKVYHGMTRVLTMSQHLRRSFIEDFDLPSERVVCVGAGVNLNRLPPDRPDKRYDTGELLFIGVEFQRKGGHVLLQAFAEVRKRHPHAVLHVVGPRSGPPAELPMEGVQWHGYLSKRNASQAALLEKLFEQSSVFVLPSLYEPFGIAPAEGMMHGLPAVVSGAWALGETVTDGESGLHVPPGEMKALAGALIRLLEAPEFCRTLGRQARQRALARFTWEGVVQRIRQALHE